MAELTANKINTMLSQDPSQLEKNNKKELTGLVSYLKGKLEELESYRMIEKRVRFLESNLIENMQYTRRESIEIHGIPESVKDDKLEEKVVDVLEEIGCGRVKSYRIHACHRLKNRTKTVIRFVSRKNADLALHHRGKLKDFDAVKHGFKADTKLYINESLCPPLQYLSYLVRTCKTQKTIETIVNFELKFVVTWLRLNKLSLNAAKTELIFFRSNRHPINYDKISIKLNGLKLTPVEFIKYLGMYIDQHLNWNTHIDELC